MHCTKCGASTTSQDVFCGDCGAPVTSDQFDMFSPSPSSTENASGQLSVSEKRASQIPKGQVGITLATEVDEVPFNLAHGEQLKAVYPMTKIKAPLGSGNSLIYVTDARLIYRARSRNLLGSGNVIQEIAVADISGTNFVVSRGMSVLGAAMYAWFLLLSLAISFWLSQNGVMYLAFPLLLIVIGLGIWRLFNTRMAFAIHTRQQPGSPIEFRLGSETWLRRLLSFVFAPTIWLFGKIGLLDAQHLSLATPLSTSKDLAEELGALVLDLQNRGTLGGE
jgi:hypothetical protein